MDANDKSSLPDFLQRSINAMQESWGRIDRGEEDIRWDCYYCELQSDINSCEVNGIISEELAWELRERYLRMERPGEIPWPEQDPSQAMEM